MLSSIASNPAYRCFKLSPLFSLLLFCPNSDNVLKPLLLVLGLPKKVVDPIANEMVSS